MNFSACTAAPARPRRARTPTARPGGTGKSWRRRLRHGPNCSRHLSPPDKVHGQLGSHLPHPWAIAHLQPPPDLPMPSHTPADRHPLIQDLAIQRMAKPIAGRDRAVGPLHHVVCLHELPPPRSGRAALVDPLHRLLHPRCHCCCGKLNPHDSRRFQVCCASSGSCANCRSMSRRRLSGTPTRAASTPLTVPSLPVPATPRPAAPAHPPP
jgi:hypothetical protein